MSKPYIIGITGGSGSGKTSFLKELTNSFSSTDICVISQDDYYKPKDEQVKDQLGIENFDLPRSINSSELVTDIIKLIAGEIVEREEYMFNNMDAKPKTLVFKPAPIIIVEGLFVFHFQEIRKLLDLKVFIHAKENLKVIRRIKRDRLERNYPLDDVLYRYEKHVMPTFEQYIAPYVDKADIIINNNTNFIPALDVVKSFLRQKLTNPKK
ncbi:MAG: P-loop NTPase fold protein [Saprospiraceae bacterium]|nr:P-loop NTPase fold protein [Saprospiraceae bacterium]